ncbi:MAG: tetratricopeptide repeat protein [Pyrinomonadaceae bacterium]
MAENFISIEEAENNLLSCATFLSEDIKSAEGYAEAMKAVVPHYLERGDVDTAAGLADTVDDPFVRDRLLMSVAEKCAAIDDDEYAFQLADAIEDFGMQEAAREAIAVQKAAKTDFEKALDIADSLSHNSNAYALIAAHFASQNHETEAEQTIEKIDFPILKAGAFQNIALINFNKGNDEKALEMLGKAAAAAEEIEHNEEKIRALLEIGNHFSEIKKNDKAIEVLDKAKSNAEKLDNVHRDSFLGNIAYGFLKAGSLELADRTLDLVSDKTQIANSLAAFSQTFWEKGEKDEAREALEESFAILKSQTEKETRDSRARFQLFATIAVLFAKFEKPERALEIAHENEDENEQQSAFSQIAQVFILQGREDLARQAIREIRDDSQKLFALIGLSDAENKQNEREKALRYLNEAAQLAETVPQFALRSSVYNELANRFQKFGETEKVNEIRQENLEIIRQIRDHSSRVVSLANLSDFYAQYEIKISEEERETLRSMVRESLR